MTFNQQEDSALLHGTTEEWAKRLDVHEKTIKRWKTGEVKIPTAIKLLLQYINCGELSGIGGKEWEGFNINKYGLFIPGWKYRFTASEIKSYFFRNQLITSKEAEINQLKRRIEELEKDLAAETERAEKYRGLITTESRWGLIWNGIIEK